MLVDDVGQDVAAACTDVFSGIVVTD
jgi:hypothetical protein